MKPPPLNPEELIDLIDQLRRAGYNISTDQLIAAQDLMITLAAHKHLPGEPQKLSTWLAPIFCDSPEEQETFYREFNKWLALPPRAAVDGGDRRLPPTGKHGSQGKSWKKLVRSDQSWKLPLAVSMVLLLAIAGVLLFNPWQRQKAQPSSAGNTDIGIDNPMQQPASTATGFALESLKGLYQRHFIWILLGAITLPFIVLAVWWLWNIYRRHRPQLEKWQTDKNPRLERIAVKGLAKHLFRDRAFRRTTQELRRHRQFGANYLDAPATISATIRKGGWFTPVYGLRQELPEYLILIDRVGFRDQQARLEDEILSRLVADGVFVERYYFHGDPRVCRKKEPGALHLSLQDLAGRHPNHNLIIFSDGASLMNPLTGRPQPWIEMLTPWLHRAILTPETHSNWGYRERALWDLDFIVAPASRDGIADLVESMHLGAASKRVFRDLSPEYPKLLQERPEHWLEMNEPERESVDELCEELRRFLGDNGYYLLCACAVYPSLIWDLTLYLGYKLTERSGLEERLWSLVRLPWFRHGVMPDWLRLRLISSLTPERELAVRASLGALLENVLEKPEDPLHLDIALQPPDPKPSFLKRALGWKRKRLMRNFVRNAPEDSLLRDYVFLTFMSGSKLAVVVPKRLRRILFRRGEAILGLRPVTAFILAALISIILGASLSSTYPEFFVNETEKANQRVDEGNKRVVEANTLGEAAQAKFKEINDIIGDFPDNRENLRKPSEELMDIIDQGASKFREASKKFDEASKLKIDEKFSEYLSFKSQEFMKRAEHFNIIKSIPQAILDLSIKDAAALNTKLTEINTSVEQKGKEWKELEARANKVHADNMDKFKQEP